jgi:hypothetical protein
MLTSTVHPHVEDENGHVEDEHPIHPLQGMSLFPLFPTISNASTDSYKVWADVHTFLMITRLAIRFHAFQSMPTVFGDGLATTACFFLPRQLHRTDAKR